VRRARIISDTAIEAQQARKAIPNATITVGQFGGGQRSTWPQKLTAVAKLTVSSYPRPRMSDDAALCWRFD
jgi:hypothetical protein